MKIDSLSAGIPICPQLGGRYALTLNVDLSGGDWVFAVASLNHKKSYINANTFFLVKTPFPIHPLV